MGIASSPSTMGGAGAASPGATKTAGTTIMGGGKDMAHQPSPVRGKGYSKPAVKTQPFDGVANGKQAERPATDYSK